MEIIYNMADYKVLIQKDTSIEKIIDEFQEYTINEKGNVEYKYKRMLLELPEWFGEPLSKVTLIIKRCSYLLNGKMRDELIFGDLKHIVCNEHTYFKNQRPVFQELNDLIEDYCEYLKTTPKNKTRLRAYKLKEKYVVWTRGGKQRFGYKYGECICFQIFGVRIKPYRM